MADLSDADKKSLLGSDYKQVEARRDAERGINDQTRLTKARQDTAATMIGGAAGIGVIAFLIGLANYYSHGTPYNPALVVGSIFVVIASVATAAWFMHRRKTSN